MQCSLSGSQNVPRYERVLKEKLPNLGSHMTNLIACPCNKRPAKHLHAAPQLPINPVVDKLEAAELAPGLSQLAGHGCRREGRAAIPCQKTLRINDRRL